MNYYPKITYFALILLFRLHSIATISQVSQHLYPHHFTKKAGVLITLFRLKHSLTLQKNQKKTLFLQKKHKNILPFKK